MKKLNQLKRKSIRLFLLLNAVCIINIPVISMTQSPITEKTPMPTPRSALCTSVIDGKIYTIGGLRNEEAVLSVVEVYDPLTDSWDTKTPMPTARCVMDCAVVEGKIYVIGGSDTGGPTILSTVEVYDPATDTWETKTSMPAPRSDVAVEAVNGKIYVIGGSKRTGTYWAGLKTVEEYDPATDTWTTKSEMPTARWSLGTSVIDNKIYAVGGNTQYPTIASALEVYDPATDTWDTNKTPIPTSRYSLSTCFFNGKIFAFGGWKASGGNDGDPMYKLVEEYDVKTNEWIQSTDMPQNMALFSAETVNGKIYLVGGTGKQHTFNSLNTTLEYNPISTINEPAWVLMNNLDPGGLTCIVDTLIYSFGGGWEGRNIGEDVKSYNTVTNEWNELTPMPMPWIEGGIGLIGDKIYLAGGWTGDWVTTDSIMEYDIAIDTFVFKKKNPKKIGSSASCVMNEKIYLFGGWGDPFPNVSYPYDALNYDPVNEQWNNLPDMNFPHLMHATAEVIDENIYVLGGVGLGPNHTPQQPEKFDGEKWEFIAEMPIPVTLHKSVVHNNKIIVFGGDSLWTQSHSYSTNFIQEYDPATDTWRIMEPMPFQRSAMFGGKVGNYVFLTGGNIDDRDPLTFVPEVWRFNLDSLKVKAAGPVPGIAKTKANQMVLVYPNPANDILHIKVPNQFQNEFELRLISITGKVFCHKYGFIKQIDISGIPPGAYLISVKSKDFVTTKKIIKQ